MTAEAYEAHLEANLSRLLERFKTGRYRAPAVRRVHIPKDGARKKTRPIGIPTLEDKVPQRAVLMVLEPVYEQDFLSCRSRKARLNWAQSIARGDPAIDFGGYEPGDPFTQPKSLRIGQGSCGIFAGISHASSCRALRLQRAPGG